MKFLLYCLHCFWGLFILTAILPSHAAEDERPVENAAKFKFDPRLRNALPTVFLEGDSTVRVGSLNRCG